MGGGGGCVALPQRRGRLSVPGATECLLRMPFPRTVRRTVQGPLDTLAVPMSTSQEVGWGAKTAVPMPTTGKAFPRVACEETKYLEELLKSGVTF
jgi:hypothetical protein